MRWVLFGKDSKKRNQCLSIKRIINKSLKIYGPFSLPPICDNMVERLSGNFKELSAFCHFKLIWELHKGAKRLQCGSDCMNKIEERSNTALFQPNHISDWSPGELFFLSTTVWTLKTSITYLTIWQFENKWLFVPKVM